MGFPPHMGQCLEIKLYTKRGMYRHLVVMCNLNLLDRRDQVIRHEDEISACWGIGIGRKASWLSNFATESVRNSAYIDIMHVLDKNV